MTDPCKGEGVSYAGPPASSSQLFLRSPDNKTGRPICPIIRSSQEKLHIRIGKTYLAIVRGWAPEALVIDQSLVEKDRPPSEKQLVRVPPAQTAITDLPVLLGGTEECAFLR